MHPMPSSKVPAALQSRLDALVLRAEAKLGRRVESPTLNMKQRGRIAGCARLQHNEIRLNPVLWEDNQQTFLDEVLPHELSHLLVFQNFGRVRPHGKEWQHMMLHVFGVVPQTRHSMDTQKVEGRQFAYRCGCTSHQLSVRRHNKVLRNQQTYACRRCGQTLVQISDGKDID